MKRNCFAFVQMQIEGVPDLVSLGALGSTDSLADGDAYSNCMLQAGAPFWVNLPEDLLVSVFDALDHPLAF